MADTFYGYVRPDGQVGSRNFVAVIPSVTCANDVAQAICRQVQGCVTYLHHQGCCQMPPDLERVTDTLISLGKSPNTGAVLIVSLGCEGTDHERMYNEIKATGKHVEIIHIQELGGVSNAIRLGTDIARKLVIEVSGMQRQEVGVDRIVMTFKCGASDTTSGMASNCVIGYIADKLVDQGATVIFGETTEFLGGEHLLLAGPKATGKNVLAENLAAVFGRPNWDVSMYVNVDAASLIGADTLKDGKVVFREGPICQCARLGGFGVLDEVNMAKNEALAVLHATLDFRRVIDVPGYERIELDPATRFIGTMNYGYAGTRELNEALVSRFVVLDMPVISEDNLQKLLRRGFPELSTKWVEQFSALFRDLRQKCDNGEISTKALDLRGLLSSLHLIEKGITSGEALKLGIINKAFDPFERQLVADAVWSRIPQNADRAKLFGN